MKGPGTSRKFTFSDGNIVIHLWIHLNGNINFKNEGIIICNKYAWDALKTICFSVNIENNTFNIMDWSNNKNRIFISASFLLQGISQLEEK